MTEIFPQQHNDGAYMQLSQAIKTRLFPRHAHWAFKLKALLPAFDQFLTNKQSLFLIYIYVLIENYRNRK